MKKKLFSSNKFSKENLKKFLNKEGFYVVLFLCITTIATSGVYIARHTMENNQMAEEEEGQEIVENIDDYEYYQPEDLQGEEEDQEVSTNQDDQKKSQSKEETKEGQDVEQEATAGQESASQKQDQQQEQASESTTDQGNDGVTDGDIPNATAVTSNNTEEEDKANKSPANAQEVLNNLVNPVTETTITMDYSFQAAPVFSSTLNEFRSDHTGVDITATKGTEVKAAMNGKVVSIEKDAKLGTLITIDHGNGAQTKYGNLDSNVSVTKNDQVKKGQVIGKAGNSAMFEIDDDPHVHFEVWNGEASVDPKEYIDLKSGE